MTERCAVPGCRGEVAILYLGHNVCDHCWFQFTADDAPLDRLKVVLGIEAAATAKEDTMESATIAAETAATEVDMTEKKAPAKATKTKSKSKKVPAKVTRPRLKKDEGSKPARVFAIRVTDEELAAIHKASGPRNATRFIRSVAAAFASEDEGAFKAVLKEAAELRR